MFLVETWLNSTTGEATLMEARFQIYDFHQSVRQSMEGGGIAAIFSTRSVCNDVDRGEFTAFEYLDFPHRYPSLFPQEFSDPISLGITTYD